MSSENDHAKLSPSAAHRWIPCPPSLAACDQYPDDGNEYADEGSTAHEIVAEALRRGTTAADAAKTTSLPDGWLKYVNDAMIEVAQGYVDFVRSEVGKGELVVEEKVNFAHSLDTPTEFSFGTVDAYIFDLQAKTLKVIDFKYGYNQVEAEHNPQLKLYALGVVEVLEVFEPLPPNTALEVIIYQPRGGGDTVKRAKISLYQLRQFAQVAGKSATKALAGEGNFNAGPVQCKYCAHKMNCDAYVKYSTDDLIDFLDELGEPAQQVDNAIATVPNAKADELSKWMSAAPKLEAFCKAVRAEVERHLLDGREIPGFKLVEGRLGDRKWVDEDEVIKTLKSMRLKEDDIYKKTLNNPTQITKKLGDSARKQNRIAPLITRSPGKPSVAPEDDPRPALSSAQDMIENLDEKG